MTNITILALGSRGDVQPAIALGKALTKHGYKIKIFAGQNFADWIQAEGLQAIPYNVDYVERFQDESGIKAMELGDDPEKLVAFMAAQRNTEVWKNIDQDTYKACVGADAVISFNNLSISMAIAEKLNIKHIEVCFYPTVEDNNTIFNNSHTFDDAHNKFRTNDLGLAPLTKEDFFKAGTNTLHLHAYSAHIATQSENPPGNVHVTGFIFLESSKIWNPPQDLLEFLSAGKPPISIGFGSMTIRNPEAHVAMFVDAIQRCDQRAILLSGWAQLGQYTSLPDNIFCAQDIPHDWLFGRTAAAIHHGGAGTVAMASKCGIPSIIIPFWFDQFYWGEQIHKLGVGPKPIPRDKLSSDQLACAIEQVIYEEDMKRRAQELGTHINNENGTQQACKIIYDHLHS